MRCIFCGGDACNSSRSHILPESLGGGAWACLRDGLVCSGCNQYFGSKVENKALSSFPFLALRLLLGIPTKKGNPAEMQTYLGALRSGQAQGMIGLDPLSPAIEEEILRGRLGEIRLIAEPTEPLSVVRMLLKMGLEVVAMENIDDAYTSKFDSARDFARSPKSGDSWWWYLRIDHNALFTKFRWGVTAQEWCDDLDLSVHTLGGVEVFRLQILDSIMFTPLYAGVSPPDMSEFPEPEHRLFIAKC